MCSRHLSASTGFSTCLDCVARGAEQEILDPPGTAKPGEPLVYRPPAHPDDWAYDYRHRYYRARSYAPFSYGDSDDTDSYYDDYDLRSFDRDLGSRGSLSLTDDAGDPGKPDWGDS